MQRGVKIGVNNTVKPQHKEFLISYSLQFHDTGCLGLVHWDDLEGWCEEGGGFRMGSTCIPVAVSF